MCPCPPSGSPGCSWEAETLAGATRQEDLHLRPGRGHLEAHLGSLAEAQATSEPCWLSRGEGWFSCPAGVTVGGNEVQECGKHPACVGHLLGCGLLPFFKPGLC